METFVFDIGGLTECNAPSERDREWQQGTSFKSTLQVVRPQSRCLNKIQSSEESFIPTCRIRWFGIKEIHLYKNIYYTRETLK